LLRRHYDWVRPERVWGGISFAPGITLKEQEHIYQYLTQLNQWSVVGQFAFGEYTGLLPPQATGTEIFVQEGWHQWSQPHFTAHLKFTYGNTYVSTLYCSRQGVV